jgi:hypothetical protein
VRNRTIKQQDVSNSRSTSIAFHEIITTSAGMGDHSGKVAPFVEDHTIGAWSATRVRVETVQNRKLLVRPSYVEVKPFSVVERVRVVVRS